MEDADLESLSLEIARKLDDGTFIVLRGPPEKVKEVASMVRSYGANWLMIIYSPPWDDLLAYSEYARYMDQAEKAPYRITSDKPLRRRVLIRRMAKASFDYMDAPVVDSLCASLKHCFLCVDSCPEGAIIRGKPVKIDLNKCTECGACINACPAGYLIPPSFSIEGLKRLLEGSELLQVVPLSKLEDAKEGRVLRAQEGSYPLVAFLMAEDKGARIKGIDLAFLDPYLEELSSLPLDDKGTVEVRRYNDHASMEASLIASRLKDEDEWIELNYLNFFRVKASEECTLCGVCEKVCPTEALRIVKDGDSMRLEFSHQQCIGCGACEKSCPEKAIKVSRELNPHLLRTGEYREETRDKIARCRGCGAPLQGTVRMIEKLEERIRKDGNERFAELVWYCERCKERKLLEDVLS